LHAPLLRLYDVPLRCCELRTLQTGALAWLLRRRLLWRAHVASLETATLDKEVWGVRLDRLRFRVQGSGFRVQGSGFRGQGEGVGFIMQQFMAKIVGFMV